MPQPQSRATVLDPRSASGAELKSGPVPRLQDGEVELSDMLSDLLYFDIRSSRSGGCRRATKSRPSGPIRIRGWRIERLHSAISDRLPGRRRRGSVSPGAAGLLAALGTGVQYSRVDETPRPRFSCATRRIRCNSHSVPKRSFERKVGAPQIARTPAATGCSSATALGGAGGCRHAHRAHLALV